MGLALAARKADTRHKIKLGGLVIKAGLGTADAALVLGALLELATTLSDATRSGDIERLRTLGKAAFENEPTPEKATQPAVSG